MFPQAKPLCGKCPQMVSLVVKCRQKRHSAIHFTTGNASVYENIFFHLQASRYWLERMLRFAFVSLWHIPPAVTFKNPIRAPDWAWREGEAVEVLKRHSTSCALPLAHNMECCLRASAAPPASISNQVLKCVFQNVC